MFHVLQCQRTPSDADYIVDTLDDNPLPPNMEGAVELAEFGGATTGSLKKWAKKTNPEVVSWLAKDWRQEPLNMVIVDFSNEGDVVASCISRNA